MSARRRVLSETARELAAQLRTLGAAIVLQDDSPDPVVAVTWRRQLDVIGDRLSGSGILRRMDVLAVRGLVAELRECRRVMQPKATGEGLLYLARLLADPNREVGIHDDDRRRVRPEVEPAR